MRRVWVGVVVGVCAIVAVVLVLVLRDSDDKTANPAADRTSTGPSAAGRSSSGTSSAPASRPTSGNAAPGPTTATGTNTSTPGGDTPTSGPSYDPSALSSRAGVGLRRFIAAHQPTSARPAVSLRSCTYGTVRGNARAVDDSGDGTASSYRIAQAVVQRYRIRVPYNGSVGDRGNAVSCFGNLGKRTIFGLSATTNAQPVPSGRIKGLQGPLAYADGSTYTNTDTKDLCLVYWVPPRRDYDLVVVFRTEASPTLAQCRRGFAAAAPTMLRSLAAFAG